MAGLTDDLGYLLARTSGLVMRATNAALAGEGLRVRQYAVLVLAWPPETTSWLPTSAARAPRTGFASTPTRRSWPVTGLRRVTTAAGAFLAAGAPAISSCP